jgi:hypothetical protein
MTQTRALLLSLFLAAFAPPWAAAQTLPPGYAGSDTCKICHEDIYNGLAKNPHHQLAVDAKRGWVGRECEACHGPGQAHTEGPSASNIRNPAKLSAEAADKICLNCHLNQPTRSGGSKAATPTTKSRARPATRCTPACSLWLSARPTQPINYAPAATSTSGPNSSAPSITSFPKAA